MGHQRIIASIGDRERAENLGQYFRDYLSAWLAELIPGMSISGYSEAVMRQLVMALLEHAAAVLISASDAAKDEPDEDTAERAKRAAAEVFAILQREVLS